MANKECIISTCLRKVSYSIPCEKVYALHNQYQQLKYIIKYKFREFYYCSEMLQWYVVYYYIKLTLHIYINCQYTWYTRVVVFHCVATMTITHIAANQVMTTKVLGPITSCAITTALVNINVTEFTGPVRLAITLTRRASASLTGVSNVSHITVANTSTVSAKWVVTAFCKPNMSSI